MPWKVLGQKWHFLRKGFPPGKTVAWETEVLEELCEMLHDSGAGRAVPVEQPAAGALHAARAARAVGHDPDQKAARAAACT